MIGISFYLNDPLAEERIALAGKMGVKRAFTSLHIPEESGDDLAARAKSLLQAAKEAGIEVYADVSARTPAHLGLESLSSLKSLGVIGLRLDDFFDRMKPFWTWLRNSNLLSIPAFCLRKMCALSLRAG